MRFSIRCPVFPTEDADLIMKSLLAYFPHCKFTLSNEERGSWIESDTSEMKSFEKLRSVIHELRIIDATKRVISTSWTGTMFVLRLDKQAAVRSRISIVDDSDIPPLGSIEIAAFCESDEVYESFVRWFTPLTKDGKVIKD